MYAFKSQVCNIPTFRKKTGMCLLGYSSDILNSKAHLQKKLLTVLFFEECVLQFLCSRMFSKALQQAIYGSF